MKLNKNLFNKFHWLITIFLLLSTLMLVVYIAAKNNHDTVSIKYDLHSIENFTSLNCKEIIENDFSIYTPDSSYYSILSSRGRYNLNMTISRSGQFISSKLDDNTPETYQIDNESNEEVNASNPYASIYISKINGYLTETIKAATGPVQQTSVYSCSKVS